jgi:hypothetical protein
VNAVFEPKEGINQLIHLDVIKVPEAGVLVNDDVHLDEENIQNVSHFVGSVHRTMYLGRQHRGVGLGIVVIGCEKLTSKITSTSCAAPYSPKVGNPR